MTTPIEHTEAGHPWYLGPYFVLAMTLILTVVAYPLAVSSFANSLLKLVLSALLAAGLYAVVDYRRLFRFLAIVILPLIALNWLSDSATTHPLLGRLSVIASAVFLATVMLAVFTRVIRSTRVTGDIVFGSVAVYLLFGVVMALMYDFVNNINPGSVISSVEGVADAAARRYLLPEFLYFSFITLTSVGYGDLAPLEAPARSLAMFEGIVGQLYVAILIARLVGIQVAQE